MSTEEKDVNYTRLSIVIPVYNKWNFTKSCLNDLLQLPADHEIVIIDNASSDETNIEVNKIASELNSQLIEKDKVWRLAYYRNDINLGFAKACNKGYRIALGENILFLNNDIRVKSDHETWTQKILEYCDEKTLVGPTMGELDKYLNFKQEANKLLTGDKVYMSGWCVGASKNTWDQLILPEYKGPFSEEFGLAYFEDTDLGFRAHMSGIKSTVVDIPVVHFGKQTSKQLNTYQLYSEARQIFIKKWGKS